MTKKTFLQTWIVLIIFTIATAIIANYFTDNQYTKELILGISILKFIGVAFYFMELKKAHTFWKASMIIFLALFYLVAII